MITMEIGSEMSGMITQVGEGRKVLPKLSSCQLYSGSMVLSESVRLKLRSLTPTGSKEFDRQRLLLVYDTRSGAPRPARSLPRIPGWRDTYSILDVWTNAEDYIVESNEPAAQVTYFKLLQFLLLLVDKIHSHWCEVARFRQAVFASAIACALRHRLRRSLNVKSLNTPLRIFPHSIRPIEST